MDFHHDTKEERRVSAALRARVVRHGGPAGGAAMDVRSRCLLLHYFGNVSRRQLLLRREQFEVQQMSLSRDRRDGISAHRRA